MPDAPDRPPNAVSVVTPTYRRPEEVRTLLESLEQQSILPHELILVDGAPPDETSTEDLVEELRHTVSYPCRYIRHGGGTAIQRNVGIDAATGDFVAFVDDDIRLDPGFLDAMLQVFARDTARKVGGVVGYRSNEYFHSAEAQRWRWYRRLGLLTTFEPGHYDFKTGYPINANMQPPFTGVRRVDFMTTSCAVWRREVFDAGLRFDLFFRDYGVLEDAHFSLRAGQTWELLQCGDACCIHDHSPRGRVDGRRRGYKCVANYYYVFGDIVRPLTWRHKLRFWRYQAFELLRIAASAVRHRRSSDVMEVVGRMEAFVAVARGIAFKA